MSDRIYGIAIIGFGGMGRRHSELLANIPRIQLQGIYDILPAQNEVAKQLGLNTYTSYEAVLSDSNVDVILIATPNDTHKEIAIKALKAGKNVICEKPVTVNAKELEEIIKVADEVGKLFVGHQNRRWDEDFLTVKKIYDEKIVGDVFHIETRGQGSRGIPQDWRREAVHGGGMLLDWGVHLIDRLLYLVKEPVKKIYCKLSYILGQEVDDGFHLFLLFESGRTAIVEASTWNFKSLPKWYMLGKKGTAVIDDWDLNGCIALLRNDGNHDVAPVKSAAGYTKTMAPREDNSIEMLSLPPVQSDVCDFYRGVIAALDGTSASPIPNRDILRVMRLIDKAFESDRLGQTVDLENNESIL